MDPVCVMSVKSQEGALNTATCSTGTLKRTFISQSAMYVDAQQSQAHYSTRRAQWREGGSEEALLNLAAIFLLVCVSLFLGMTNIFTSLPQLTGCSPYFKQTFFLFFLRRWAFPPLFYFISEIQKRLINLTRPRVKGEAGGWGRGRTALALIVPLFQKYNFNPRPHRVTHVRHLHGRNWT